MTALTNNYHFPTIDSANEAFDALFYEHYDRVYGILFRLVGTRSEAEDLLQEVFLKLYNNPPKRADSNIGAWLYRVATNAAYNAIRSRKRRWERDRLLVPEDDGTNAPDQLVAIEEEKSAVRAALSTLKPEQAQLLLLRQMGMSYQELATACDLNPNSVGQLLARAGKAFKVAYIKETRGKQNHV